MTDEIILGQGNSGWSGDDWQQDTTGSQQWGNNASSTVATGGGARAAEANGTNSGRGEGPIGVGDSKGRSGETPARVSNDGSGTRGKASTKRTGDDTNHSHNNGDNGGHRTTRDKGNNLSILLFYSSN